MTSSKPKKWLWIFCPEMTLPDVPEIPQIGVKRFYFSYLCLKLNLSLYSYYLQSLQRLSTRVCKYFRPESLPGLSEWKSMQTFEGAKVFADSRGKSLQTLDVITPEFRFESLYLSDFQSESLQRLWR